MRSARNVFLIIGFVLVIGVMKVANGVLAHEAGRYQCVSSVAATAVAQHHIGKSHPYQLLCEQ
ncbi:hypothetical protein H6778_01290 [Candidatus Nomurabacteria bacterium]|nr:hypothetical protein [Candidatus Nomurabacteria bacterium]